MVRTTAARRAEALWLSMDTAPVSTAIVARVEQNIRQQELKFGRKILLQTIAGMGSDVVVEHVARYRAVIRTGKWPNENRPSPFETFCSEYERSAHAYVNVGFEALRFIEGSSCASQSEIYQRVAASEALRGQYGKRSPTGLDRRLEQTVDALAACIAEARGDDALDEQLNLLCLPTMGFISAEAALLEDFAPLRKAFPGPPTIDDLVNASYRDQEVAWTFLRRHAKWSLACLHNCYVQFGTHLFREWMERARQRRQDLAIQREVLIAEISRTLSPAAATEIMTLATEAMVLNQLNLTLEPSCSFKGGPGLAHGVIFGTAPAADLSTDIAQERLLRDKWTLFTSTSTTGE